MQARVRPPGPQEALGQEIDSLLAGEAAGVENLDLAGELLARGLAGSEASNVDPPLPAA
jgi:hypothetical protein